MASAAAIRLQIESALSRKIPSALTPAPRMRRPAAASGIASLDELLQGGLPLGAITEMAGPECSGRSSAALSFLSHMTAAAKVCAWVDASDALDPLSAAAAGVDLARLLWVRCAPLGKGSRGAAWRAIEQALRATDLLLQAGGFGAIVLDLGSLEPEFVTRVPAATWFRYRAAAERARSSLLLITQHACAAGGAELLLRFLPGAPRPEETTVLTGLEHHVEVGRRRFAPTLPCPPCSSIHRFSPIEESPNPLLRKPPQKKPPQRAGVASWQSLAAWAGPQKAAADG